MNLQDKVSGLSGVGPKRVEQLKKLNINTIEDMLLHFPRRYEDRRTVLSIMEAPIGEDVLISGKAISSKLGGSPYGKKRLLKVLFEDNSGIIEAVFFNAGYLASYIKIGKTYSLFGKITINFGKRQMAHPEFHVLGDKGDVRGLFPVYPLTDGISQTMMRNWQMEISDMASRVEEWLPEEIVSDNHLCSPSYAISNIHFPKEEEQVNKAKYRLIFEELLTLQTGLFYIKKGFHGASNGIAISKDISVAPLMNSLPFELTEGQRKVLGEIERDLAAPGPMNRLVQGDVGSGKTIVSELAMYKTAKGGYQSVMMAPTELLAKQHLSTLRGHFKPLGIAVDLLCSSTKPAERRRILEELSQGKIDILVGTHAVIQPDVVFHNLGLVVTDEQHRFGVNQRELLANKGQSPNILVMTATPIPRTLAVILFGDLDISIIDTLPSGRKPIRTFLRYRDSRKKIYDFVESQVKEGRQAYVVAPLIEESDAMDCYSADEIYQELCQKYRNLRIGLVHGAMKQAEKDHIMQEFSNGNIDVLVSTVVIEVGIDVGNATVMVIENCERFGLAQLHQLRGRVGRSGLQSFCILICGNDSKVARQRNEILCSTEDGFKIAEEDLKLRGPGEIFGTRQHGLPELNVSDLVSHVDILDKVKDIAIQIIENDPALTHEKNKGLRSRIKHMFGENIQLRL